MFDCNSDITKFHNSCVSLSKTQQDTMRARRKANRNRLVAGLDAQNLSPESFQPQGSYAMHTMVQDESNDYDIDDGVIFKQEDLVGKQGAFLTALKCRQIVHDAILADNQASFTTPPEVLKNCVRVHYNDGTHVDIPVYSQDEDNNLQLASSEWKASDPESITNWFNSSVIDKSPDTSNGRQMRRITKLLKKISRSRDSWKNQMPSGFILSILVDECYSPNERDDLSLYNTIENIRNRLNTSKQVFHPITFEPITKTTLDPNIVFLRDKLNMLVGKLSILFDNDCDRKNALNAWNHAFKNEFFDNLVDAIDQEQKSSIAKHFQSGSKAVGASVILSGSNPSLANTSVKTTRAYGRK